MKEKLSVVLGVLAAAYVVWGIFAPRLPPPRADRPLSTAAGPSGHLGLQRWLEESGIPTHSFREPYSALARRAGPFTEPGNVFITVMPFNAHPGRDELNALLDWVSDGNTLVILAALNDTPRWLPAADRDNFIDDFGYLTSLTATFRNADAPDGEPLEFSLATLPGHWLTDGAEQLVAVSDLLTGFWDIQPDPGVAAFVIARAPAVDVDALLITDFGEGALVVSTFASLWQNSLIGEGDNRRIVTNLLAHHLGPGGAVLFDDYHQGLSAVYDARAFFGDPRLAWTVGLLLAFWLLYAVFSESRLGRAVEPAGPPSQTDFVRTLGRFLARKVARRDVGLRLVENFVAHVRPHFEEASTDAVWQQVLASPRMDSSLARALLADYRQLRAGRTIDLQKLQRRLSAARRAFS